jgi:hypothetical protein
MVNAHGVDIEKIQVGDFIDIDKASPYCPGANKAEVDIAEKPNRGMGIHARLWIESKYIIAHYPKEQTSEPKYKATKPLEPIKSGESKMESETQMYDVDVIAETVNERGNVTKRVIASKKSILAPSLEAAAFLTGLDGLTGNAAVLSADETITVKYLSR